MQSDNTDVNAQTALVSDNLTPEQAEKWHSTSTAMLHKCPGFRHLWLRLLSEAHNGGRAEHLPVISRQTAVAATDGKNIIVNPDTFFNMKLMERVFVSAHEIVHNVYGDVENWHRMRQMNVVPLPSGNLPWDEEVAQKSGDYRINAMLVTSKIGDPPKDENGNKLGCFDDTMDGTESFFEVYEKEYKKKHKDDEDGDEPGGQQAPGNNPGGFDNVLSPGASTSQSSTQAAAQRNPQKWAMEIATARALEEMRSQGNMPAALKRMFQEILEPEVNWLDHIETCIKRVTGNDIYDWKWPDPWFIGRDIYLPSKTGYGAGWVVLWGDTSGSRDDKELASNMAELKGILEDVRPKRLTILWCDAAIDYVDEIEDTGDLDTIQSRGTGGGGGTSVQPVMDWIAESQERPDLFIGFTDGAVSFPTEPSFPVIWASSTDATYPYGEVVRVNKGVPRA